MFFSKMYDILGLLNFLYLPQKTQQIFFLLTILKLMENILVLFYHSFHIRLEKINLYALTNVYLST